MTQSVGCLPNEHGDLSLIPSLWRRLGMVVLIISEPERLRQANPVAHWMANLSEHQDTQRPRLKSKQTKPTNTQGGWLLRHDVKVCSN